jgi:hypothetical protein
MVLLKYHKFEDFATIIQGNNADLFSRKWQDKRIEKFYPLFRAHFWRFTPKTGLSAPIP